jgi:hypothetical protein
MPFQSKKQRSYMKRRLPKLYKKWKKEHGTKIVRKNKRR